jgi:hypothetical protein
MRMPRPKRLTKKRLLPAAVFVDHLVGESEQVRRNGKAELWSCGAAWDGVLALRSCARLFSQCALSERRSSLPEQAQHIELIPMGENFGCNAARDRNSPATTYQINSRLIAVIIDRFTRRPCPMIFAPSEIAAICDVGSCQCASTPAERLAETLNQNQSGLSSGVQQNFLHLV